MCMGLLVLDVTMKSVRGGVRDAKCIHVVVIDVHACGKQVLVVIHFLGIHMHI